MGPEHLCTKLSTYLIYQLEHFTQRYSVKKEHSKKKYSIEVS